MIIAPTDDANQAAHGLAHDQALAALKRNYAKYARAIAKAKKKLGVAA